MVTWGEDVMATGFDYSKLKDDKETKVQIAKKQDKERIKVAREKKASRKPDTDIHAPNEQEMEDLKNLLKEAEDSESKFNFVDNSDQAKAILITGMMTSELEKLKHLSELDTKLINGLIVLGTVDKFLKKRRIDSPVRSFIYSEILTLMISYKRKGRQEFIQLGQGEDSRNGMMRRLREKFGGYVG